MSHEVPYWELGRLDHYTYPFSHLATKNPEQLEIDLIQFVNANPETFNDKERESINRVITRAFAMGSCPFQSRGDIPTHKPGLSVIAQWILKTISDKITKGREINTSQEVKDALTKFEVCVEFIDKFLPALCATESGPFKLSCERIADAVKQHWTGHVPNIFKTFQSYVNRYQARVLNLWADVIREDKIPPAAIAEMQAVVSAKDGYERKMRELLAECGGGYAFKPNLDESMLLKWLTLFHVTISKDSSMINLTNTYVNGGHASTLDGIVFGIMSQFMPIHNVYNYSHIPQSKKHESELNMLHLTCNVIQKNPPGSGPNTPQPPVYAYLSSNVLDQCVQSVGRFPTTDQFIQYMNTRMIEKAAAFAPPPPLPPSESLRLSSAPLLSDLGGGKKTRRIMRKKRKPSKKSRHHRRR
jgi:hypothetical protein